MNRFCRTVGVTGVRAFSTTCRRQIPFNLVHLSNRNLLSVQGRDAVKLLQGLITNQLTVTSRSTYAAFLKPEGKMLHDVFIYPLTPTVTSSSTSLGAATTTDQSDAFLIDHHAEHSTLLRSYLRRHILRSKVKLGKEVEQTRLIYAAWRNEEPATAEEIALGEKWLSDHQIGVDSRAPGMGWRWPAEIESDQMPPTSLFKSTSLEQYQLHRLKSAVPEGPSDWATLPLEGNLDYMGGVDYKKGCYVGQELTARTHHRGVVRKRIVGLRLFREGDPIPTEFFPSTIPLTPHPDEHASLPPPQSTLTPFMSTTARPRPSGKIGTSMIVSGTGSDSNFVLGLGCVRLEQIKPGQGMESVFIVTPPVIEGEEVASVDVVASSSAGKDRWLAKAFIPDWIQTRLDAERVKE